jgi:hypothetical protein
MLPAAIAGWVVNNRGWSWVLIGLVYIVFVVSMLVIVVIPK